MKSNEMKIKINTTEPLPLPHLFPPTFKRTIFIRHLSKTHTILHITRASKTNIYRYVRWLHFISIIVALLTIFLSGVHDKRPNPYRRTYQQNFTSATSLSRFCFLSFFLSLFLNILYRKKKNPKTERDSICHYSMLCTE